MNKAHCEIDECSRPTAFRLYRPELDPTTACVPHGRSLAQQPGAVARVLPGKEDEWP